MPKPTDYDKTHLRNMAAIGTRIDRIFKKATEEAAKIGVSIKAALPDDRIFSFADFPETKKQIERLLTALQQSMETTIVNGVRSAWTLSNNKNNALVSRIFGDRVGNLTKEQYKRYYSNNEDALQAFLQRQTKGLNLSDRVWKYTQGFKREIELGLDLGLRSGTPAAKMARDLKQYLQHPDKLFRRVRDQHGILRLSQAAREFHPRQGVYRSSYRNARRLAVTETNMAYHTADYIRWQQLDFVVGIEIKVSGNHTIENDRGQAIHFTDICDTLAGRYPKDFKFVGWHPHCRCQAISILKTEEEMEQDTQRILDGQEPKKGSVNEIKTLPATFRDWVEEHSERIEKGGNLPYFIKDNKFLIDKFIIKKINPKILTEEEFLSYSKQMNISKEQWEELYNGEDVYIDSSWSREINANLSKERIGAVVPDGFMDTGSYKQITTLDEVINNNQLKEDLLVYRKVSQQWLEREGISFKEGSVVHEYGYTSTSAVPGHNIIRKSRNVTLEIIAPKGSKAYITENIDESEIIFPRNSDFKVLSVTDNNGNPIIRLQLISKNRTQIRVVKTAEQKAAIQKAWNARRIDNLTQSIADGYLPKEVAENLPELAAKDLDAFNDRIKFLQQRAARHASRTPADRAAIQQRWDEKLKRDAKTRRDADRVLALAKTWNEVDYTALESIIASGNLTAMPEETRKLMDALKAMRAPEVKATPEILEFLKDPRKGMWEGGSVAKAVDDWTAGVESKTMLALIENSEYTGQLFRAIDLSPAEAAKFIKSLKSNRTDITSILNMGNEERHISWSPDRKIVREFYGAPIEGKETIIFHMKSGKVRGFAMPDAEDSEVVLSGFSSFRMVGVRKVKDKLGEYTLVEVEPINRAWKAPVKAPKSTSQVPTTKPAIDVSKFDVRESLRHGVGAEYSAFLRTLDPTFVANDAEIQKHLSSLQMLINSNANKGLVSNQLKAAKKYAKRKGK